MAVFTELSDEDRQSIAGAYGFTSLLSVIGIADGDTETTYLFRTAQGEFIVTLFENGAQPLDLESAFDTMEVLFRQGVPCPKPLRTVKGNATFEAAGRLVATVSFVRGASTNLATVPKCRSLGRVVAQIHWSLERRANSSVTELPKGAIHGALVRENVFFLGDEVSGVINFRLRHEDALISELADVLVEWSGENDGKLEMERSRALIQGYQDLRRLTEAEKEALPGFVMASTSRRFASTKERTLLPGAALEGYRSATSGLFG